MGRHATLHVHPRRARGPRALAGHAAAAADRQWRAQRDLQGHGGLLAERLDGEALAAAFVAQLHRPRVGQRIQQLAIAAQLHGHGVLQPRIPCCGLRNHHCPPRRPEARCNDPSARVHTLAPEPVARLDALGLGDAVVALLPDRHGCPACAVNARAAAPLREPAAPVRAAPPAVFQAGYQQLALGDCEIQQQHQRHGRQRGGQCGAQPRAGLDGPPGRLREPT
mmetsp:Transcript_50878/g.164668  ORF Transcript_50878/g.164668 Transcript_50878/m.164668 type:complete len:223 (-) Transcript_50878:36-704(-)